ncbi:MAG TPA: hypothetical protein VFE16_08530 [Candidatus Cybelea sp.]|nr:hypothetical protein [Candidatus Cybelea sp.]
MRTHAALLAAMILCACATRQAPLPSVAEVQDRFVGAIGGRTAIMAPRSITMRSRYVMYGPRGKRVVVAIVVYQANFKRFEIDQVAGRGRYLSGYDGTIGWALDPDGKTQIVSGHNAISIRRDADLYYWAHIPTYFRDMTVVGIESFAGHRCYHLRGTTLWGNENNQYYDVANGLLTGYRFHQWIAGTPEKEETRQVFERYQRFGKLSFPTRETDFRENRMTGITRLLSVEYDSVDPTRFIPPANLRARS